MPSMPPRPCTTPRCIKMIATNGKCEDHQPEPWLTSKGKSSSERGYGVEWVKQRAKALKRDGYLCQYCFIQGRMKKATEVDHVIAKANGGSNDLSNLLSTCNPCHKNKTAQDRKQSIKRGKQ